MTTGHLQPVLGQRSALSAAAHANCRPAASWEGATIDTEVLVVGTGAGGAVAGTELSRAGHRVLFVEAGGAFHQPDFARRSLVWSTTHLYASRGLQLSMGNPIILLPSGRGVGGSTLINSGICFRPPDERLVEWSEQVGDPRLLPGAMAPFVDEIWRRVGVMPTHLGNGKTHNVLFQRGCERLGLDHAWMDRNAPGCVGCGVCHLGCPSGGKASVDRAVLPEALDLGAQLRTGARVVGVTIEAGRATGAEVEVLDPATDTVLRRVRVRADLVIVGGSALGSPLLLRGSGVEHAALGRHLSVHPGSGVVADFEEPVVMWEGVPQGYWARCPDDDRVLLETVTVGPAELYGLFGRAGAAGSEIATRFSHFAMGGGMLRDEGGGTVAGPDGASTPSIRYSITERDLAGLKAGMRAVTRVYFAAGARRVAPLVHPLRFYDSEADAIAAIERVRGPTGLAHLHASHPHGTCRMGPREGPSAGVVDADGKVHGVSGLYVMDGSIFPSTLGVNPQITIMALTLALARRLASG